MQEDAVDPAQAIETGFGERVRDFRIERGWTQRQLAERLSLDASAVSRLEQGTRAIRLGEAAQIAEVLGIDFADLVFGDLDPVSELQDLRNAADSHMRITRRAAVLMTSAFLEVVEFLEENPTLLGALESTDLAAPASAEDYLEWVCKRVDYVFQTPETSNKIYVENKTRRGQLRSLLEAVIATVITDTPVAPVKVVSRHPSLRRPEDGRKT
ncbi:prophage regulatory ptotein [Mycobacteroides abscessus subsp. abscessus]|uniref:helix-turn-helix domain-containing protein n=1 Tax=Mycobacteroides abscessus TaxID=36809 RepID=UPI0005E0C73F|nr:helix-turn-helix transcriptional regulator [Mycobacteroides abscessus]CPR83082.1 prophage regulatory ptotein [Mycobacteroides abscessus]CPU79578.1 prophage regulatory ptotein [Mycobacteroides abscessus]SIA43199.1 prophage regulatory ptotein [Mycobacteroides abscessus subsp. abscessus]SIA74118.1 prophage regulatory ptotein [Mycobacteroides abscessus subsp. abscessus]SIE26446.1 prophage regulatory ptotein [Mycobacteroides abscessus subsp. abscessus]